MRGGFFPKFAALAYGAARRAVQKRRLSFEQMGLRSSSNSSALQNDMAWVVEFLIWE